jgi:pseudaminic acid biosynthesis-associated methylase
MTDQQPFQSETKRLEQLWSGEFGDKYIDRNAKAGDVRGPFWQELLARLRPARVLEVGCNVGGNLRWVAETVPRKDVFGIDVNQKAIEQLCVTLPGINAVWGAARELPFRDRWFDLVFTMGVLIHQPETTLSLVMAEIVRCSRRYILCGEYFAEQTEEVAYRGHEGALFRRNYGKLYQEIFPDLSLHSKGFLSRAQGWDDVTYWVFEKA